MTEHDTIISADCCADGSDDMHAKYRYTFRDLRHVLGGNAAHVYGFDLEALAPLAERVGPTVGELALALDRLPNRPNEALLKAAGVSGR
jgi:hypothetical protein